MKSCEIWNKIEIILGCADTKNKKQTKKTKKQKKKTNFTVHTENYAFLLAFALNRDLH